MMLRRALIGAGVVLAAGSGVALAFAADLVPARGESGARASWPFRSVTPAPAAPADPFRLGAALGEGEASGTYCPIPLANERSTRVPVADVDGATADSSALLLLQGRSAVADPRQPAICTGVSGAMTPVPRTLVVP